MDTNVFIYCFEDSQKYGEIAEYVIGQAGAGVFHAIVTPITLAELLVKPLLSDRADLADRYRSVMRNLPNIDCVALDADVGFMAGALRAKYGLALPDMFQVAAAMKSQEPTLITQDRALRKITDADIVALDDFA